MTPQRPVSDRWRMASSLKPTSRACGLVSSPRWWTANRAATRSGSMAGKSTGCRGPTARVSLWTKTRLCALQTSKNLTRRSVLAFYPRWAYPLFSALWKLVNDLPPKQQAAVKHRFVEDLGYGDIAKLLDCSEAAARRSVHEGIKRLRETWA